jgi:hypothetical protein
MIRLYTHAVLILLLSLLFTAANAQQLVSTASLVTGHISHDKLNGMKARTQTLVQLVHNCLTADNGESPNPIWHGEYLAGRSSSGELLRFGAQCSFYSPDNIVDKKAELLLLANELSPLLGHFTINGNDYGTIGAAISHRNGCLYFELPTTAFWLITADSSRLPYIPVTRREFLLEIRTQLIRDTSYISTEWRSNVAIRPAAVQEAEKQGQLRQLKTLYTGADLEVRTNIFLRNFTSDEVYLQKQISLATAVCCARLHLVDSLLHTHPADLDRPACLSTQTAAAGQPATQAQRNRALSQSAQAYPALSPTTRLDPALSFDGFADNLPGSILLVRPNPAAFDPALGAEKPQFLLLGWRFDPTAHFAASLDQQLRDNLDTRQLQDLLGK